MSQESGFFFNINEAKEPSMGEIVLIHRSSSGPCELYRARKDGNMRVFKALKPEHRGNPVYETMLRKEFGIGYSLDYNGICRTYSFGPVSGLGNCIEMEWVDGRTFREFMGESPSRKKITHVLEGICEALGYIHCRQIIHRDLKPENILVTFNGDNVKIIDFGVSDTYPERSCWNNALRCSGSPRRREARCPLRYMVGRCDSVRVRTFPWRRREVYAPRSR